MKQFKGRVSYKAAHWSIFNELVKRTKMLLFEPTYRRCPNIVFTFLQPILQYIVLLLMYQSLWTWRMIRVVATRMWINDIYFACSGTYYDMIMERYREINFSNIGKLKILTRQSGSDHCCSLEGQWRTVPDCTAERLLKLLRCCKTCT